MAPSLSLQLKQSQSLAMSPQLMELMQLIQMNHLELSQFIAQEIEQNPLLEAPPPDDAFIRRSSSRLRRNSGEVSEHTAHLLGEMPLWRSSPQILVE